MLKPKYKIGKDGEILERIRLIEIRDVDPRNLEVDKGKTYILA